MFPSLIHPQNHSPNSSILLECEKDILETSMLDDLSKESEMNMDFIVKNTYEYRKNARKHDSQDVSYSINDTSRNHKYTKKR